MNNDIDFTPIPGYGGKYLINNSGVVKSTNRIIRCNKGHRVIKGRIIKPHLHTAGYIIYNLWDNAKCKTHFAHRLVLQTFFPTNIKLDVNHINGIKTDNRIENLEWVTRQQNILHSIRLGLTKPQKTGHNSPFSKHCTDGVKLLSYSEAAKYSGYCISYFSKMMNGVYNNKTDFKPVAKILLLL